MERTIVGQTPAKAGERIKVAGWVHSRRDHGKLIFIDVRDRSGILQVVFAPGVGGDDPGELRSEWVVEIEGEVKSRPENMVNQDIPTGTVELKAERLTVLSRAEAVPIDVVGDGRDIGEEHRLKYRYLDLRRERMQNNLRSRHSANQFIRDYLTKRDFTEVETPSISKSTPEGARDYVVPSRIQPGKFYALPQSPQQYKQLLMVAGLERYFQIVRCFRDEDTRGDRQPEFTQLDLEISFASQNEILELVESLMIEMVRDLFPEKTINKKPFPRIPYAEAMAQHGSDRPDLRENKGDPNELAFAIVLNFPMFEKKDDGSVGAVHHPFTLPTYDPNIDSQMFQREGKEFSRLTETIQDEERALSLTAYQYDLVLNGYEVGGGSIRSYNRDLLQKVFELLGHSEEKFKDNFGHLYEAFGYGVPPHGGIALGLDRLYMILQNEPNIREMIAFPKTGDGRDLMMNAPSEISRAQLTELGLEIKKHDV